MSITMKSTKTEIMEAYMAAKKKLDEQDAMKDDPVAEKLKAKNAEIIASADETAKQSIFAPEILEKYNNLCAAITMKEKELQDLYGIEAKANSMIALVNAYKDKELEIKETLKNKKDEADAEYEAKKAEIEAEIAELKNKKESILKSIDEESKVLVEELKKTRKREEEEYTYNLNRERKIAEDKWTDEKAVREKALDDREEELNEREAAITGKEDYMEELKQKVEGIPALVEQATADGIKKGKADADKSNAFEVRAINTKNEYEQKALNDTISRLESDLAAKKEENAMLHEKLDAAYAQMKELAAETVKSTGGVKILSGESNGK